MLTLLPAPDQYLLGAALCWWCRDPCCATLRLGDRVRGIASQLARCRRPLALGFGFCIPDKRRSIDTAIIAVVASQHADAGGAELSVTLQ